MAKIHLTEAAVERYRRPLKERTEVSDTEPGLFLWITPNGTKSWVVVYRLAGGGAGTRTIRRKTALGRYPKLGVAAARLAAREVMELAESGVDPEVQAAEAEAADERAEAERRAGSFRAVAEEYVAAMKAGKLIGGRKRPVAMTTANGRESLLDRMVLPDLGDKPLAEISPQMIARVLSRIEKTAGPVDETLKVVRGVFKFALSRGLFHGLIPTSGMTNRQAPVKLTRALSDDELSGVWHAAGHQGWPFGSVIRLLMLTGQRKTEIAAMRWEEIDWDRQLLILPAERVKNRAGAHEVPLSEPAMRILREAQAAYDLLGEDSGLVFPSTKGTPISGWMPLKRKLERFMRGDMSGHTDVDRRAIRAGGALRADTWERKAAAKAKIEEARVAPWRIHDLRHTFITRCRDGEENADGEVIWSAPLDVLQATVNHEITAGVTQRYDHGDVQRRYRLRKRELMEWWNRKLLTVVDGPQDSVVVQMPNVARG